MDFHLSKEQEMIRKMYREFAETEVKPSPRSWTTCSRRTSPAVVSPYRPIARQRLPCRPKRAEFKRKTHLSGDNRPLRERYPPQAPS